MISAEAFSTKQSHEPASPAVNHLGLLQQQHTQGKFRGQSFYDKYCPQLRVKKKKKKRGEFPNSGLHGATVHAAPAPTAQHRVFLSSVHGVCRGWGDGGTQPAVTRLPGQVRAGLRGGGEGCGAAGKVFWRQWEGRIK